jgi:hypothetical protein
VQSCADSDANPANCYDATQAPTTEALLSGQTSGDLFTGISVLTQSGPLGHCPACALDEWQIPPMTSVSVQVLGRPFSFVFPNAQQVSAGTLTNVTGQLGTLWRECTQSTCVPLGSPNCNIMCTASTYHRAVQYVTRVHLETVPNIFVDARPSAPFAPGVSDTEAPVAARGTAQPFLYDLSRWWTTQDPYPLVF